MSRKTTKKKVNDPTNSKIKNSARFSEPKEDRWVRQYSDHSLEPVTRDPKNNIFCGACNVHLKCIQVGDIKKHVDTKKHIKNIKKWKKNGTKQSQPRLYGHCIDIGSQKTQYFNGFVFASILSHITGAGAARFNRKNQWKRSSKDVQIYINLGEINPFNPNQSKKMLNAFNRFRNGPQCLGNQLSTLAHWEREFVHYVDIVCSFMRETCDIGNSLTVLCEEDKKELLVFRNQGNWGLDIVGFLKSKTCHIVDHASDTDDAERLYNYLAMINSNPLTKSMGSEMKALRLLTLWNQELVLENITK